MKLIVAIALMFGWLMLREDIVLAVITASFFALAVWLALPVLDELAKMMEGRTLAP
jgi:hypothetical protein